MATKLSTSVSTVASTSLGLPLSLGDTIYVMPSDGLLVYQDSDAYYESGVATPVVVNTRVIRLLNDGDLVQVASPDAVESTAASLSTTSLA